MKIIYSIIIIFSVLFTLGVNANDTITVINKKHSFFVRQTQEYTSLYYKNTLITEWKNEGYSCDKEGGYSQGDLINAKVCISDELSLKNLGKNWYSFQILYKNYPGYYLYNTRSKSLYTYSAFDKILQKETGKNGLYYIFVSQDFGQENPQEFLVHFKHDGTYEQIYANKEPKIRLLNMELLLGKKIRLTFRAADNTLKTKIISLN